MEAADTLIRQERDWVPTAVGESLYLRPFMIATEAALGVKPSHEYLFLLIASPSGAYFPQGVKPVTVWISENYVRAAPGGTGSAKCAGNYAASLIAQKEAKAEGCDQVVWLDAVHRRYIEEMGGMNIFFVYQEAGQTVVVTPVLTGTLLPGITRAHPAGHGQGPGLQGRGAPHLRGRVAGRPAGRPHDRSLRLRHRRRHHPHRHRQVPARRVEDQQRRDRPGGPRSCARPCWTSSTASCPTPTSWMHEIC